jgi:serine/threonine protein kinase
VSITQLGRYQIQETLGRGAMGVVYLARDPIIDRRLALKTLRVDLDAEMTEEFRERFFREARAAGRLSHPGIVTIHDVGEDAESGLVYIAMEYIEGRDLKQLMAAGESPRPSEVTRIIAEVATALNYAHSMGVVHRDIKPANIILTSDGTAKITDFGVARLESSNLTVEGQFIGTPNFMAPEQISGGKVDGRSDLFSLGVVFYTLLTGQRPFAGATMHEVTLRIMQDTPALPTAVVQGLRPPSIRSSSSVSRRTRIVGSRPAASWPRCCRPWDDPWSIAMPATPSRPPSTHRIWPPTSPRAPKGSTCPTSSARNRPRPWTMGRSPPPKRRQNRTPALRRPHPRLRNPNALGHQLCEPGRRKSAPGPRWCAACRCPSRCSGRCGRCGRG